jgi:anti-sigma factor RsiW
MTPRDIACRELVELLTEYLDGVLPPDEKAAVDAHLDGCDACRIYLDQMRATIATLGSVPVETLSDAACDTLLAAFAERAGARHDDHL